MTPSLKDERNPPATPRTSITKNWARLKESIKDVEQSPMSVKDMMINCLASIMPTTIQKRVKTKVLPEKTKQEHSEEQVLLKIPRFILLPDSNIRLSWDFLIFLLVLLFAAKIPVEVGFNIQIFPDSVEYIFTAIFVLDMLLNFRTAFKYRGLIVLDYKKIGINYLSFWFWIDFVAVFPIDLFLGGSSTSGINEVIRLIRVVKLFRVFRVVRILKRFEDFSKLNPSIIRLIKVFSLAIMVWHWIASAYWFISEFQGFGFPNLEEFNNEEVYKDDFTTNSGIYNAFNRDGGNLWVPPPEIWCREVTTIFCNESAFIGFEKEQGYNPFAGIKHCFQSGNCPAPFSKRYVHCFFWAVMVTTGIGRDIMPVTSAEHLFSTITIVLGVFMYAFIIGSASNSLSNWDAEKAEKRQKLESINHYLRQRNIPSILQKRIRAYYDYMWSSLQSVNTRDGVLGDLHQALSLELQICLYRKIVENIPLFAIIKHSECLIDMIEQLSPKIYIPGEYLVLQGEIGEEMFIVIRGTVCILVQNPVTKIIRQTGSVSDGGVIGEDTLLSRRRREASLRAATYCDVLALSKAGFDYVLRNYPENRATICNLALGRAKGWDKVRSILKITRALHMIGKHQAMREIFLTKLPTKSPEGC